MNELIREQARELWEWCGARCLKCGHVITRDKKPDRCCCLSYELELSFKNLARWAIPKLMLQGDNLKFIYKPWGEHLWEIINHDHPEKSVAATDAKDPALALFRAVQRARGIG